MNKTRAVIVNVCRALLAITFIFSGFVKSIDPLGTQYKIADYLEAMGVGEHVPDWLQLFASIGLSATEFTLGVLLLLAIRRRFVSKLTTLLLVFMTAITAWLSVSNPIQDCGCFGDVIHLSNMETFAKNVVLLVAACVVVRNPLLQVRFISKTNQWIATYFTFLFIFIASIWSLYRLPVFDFRPYYIGQNIKKAMEVPKGAEPTQYKTTFICEKNGVRKEFDENNYPYNDSTWVFIDTHQEILKQGYEPPIKDFLITDPETGDDITQALLNDTAYTFLLISPHFETAADASFGDIDVVYEYAKEYGYPFIGVSASGEAGVSHWRNITGAEYPIYAADATLLKTIIRSNPGLILLRGGRIINKWSHNDLPKQEELTAPIAELPLGQIPANSVWSRIGFILLCYILPLSLLILADRTWAWTKWMRRRNQLRAANEARAMEEEENLNA